MQIFLWILQIHQYSCLYQIVVSYLTKFVLCIIDMDSSYLYRNRLLHTKVQIDGIYLWRQERDTAIGSLDNPEYYMDKNITILKSMIWTGIKVETWENKSKMAVNRLPGIVMDTPGLLRWFQEEV
jgi:hypothetical protein